MMEYNKQQLQAINAPENKIVVMSPCGSGKTRCLVGAIDKWRRDNPLDHIVAITFTRKAAAELLERIQWHDIEVSTIHSWAYRKLHNMAAEYGFKVQLLDDDNIKDILKKLCNLRHHYHINQFQLFSFIMGNYNIDVDDGIKKIFYTIHNDYVKFKEKYQLYDFTDLPKYLLDKLNEYGEDINDIDALFVDEFQDIDVIQLTLFNKVMARKKMYIGDSRQSIYQFRGAIEDVDAALEDFTQYNLTINYRSYQEIIDYATTLRDVCAKDTGVFDVMELEWTKPSDIICDRGLGGKIYVMNRFGNAVEIVEDKKVNDALTVRSFLEDRKTQILCRSNKQVKKLQSYGIENVSTIHQAKGLEYDNVVLVSFPIDSEEELNIAYVGLTRAKNKLCVIDFQILLYIICNEEITTASVKKLF